MKSIRVLIVDDERIGRMRLRRTLEQQPDVEVVGECADGLEALEALAEHRPDLLLLDINLPGMDGFELLEQLEPDEQPIVVFVTAYEKHAVRAFDACALDYLLKPVSPERLTRTLDRVRAQLGLAADAETPPGVFLQGRDLPGVHRFAVRRGARVSFVAAEEIDWIEAAGNYAIFHVGRESHMVRETMSSLEARLPGEHFMRVSRSAIVNLHRVKELNDSRRGDDAAVLFDGQRVPMTRAVREVTERLVTLGSNN